MIMSSSAFQFESDNGDFICLDLRNGFSDDNPFADMPVAMVTSRESDWEELNIYTCWKEQTNDRFGAGSPAPSIPRSQRLYDGDNYNDYCEVWIG